MMKIRLVHYNNRIDLNVDEKIDARHLLAVATYRQLVLASQCILTVYDLSSLLLRQDSTEQPIVCSYEIITVPNRILSLTSTIDRIMYVYRSMDNQRELKVCSHPSQQQRPWTIESENIDDSIHLCAIDDGTSFLAVGSTIFSSSSSSIRWSFDSLIVKMSGGKEHALALLADGRVFAWGHGLHGALGLGDLEPCSQPTHVEALSSKVIDIAAGGWHSLALLSDGSVMAWGWNGDGSLGLISQEGDDDEDISGVFCEPTLVTCLPLGVDCTHVSAGARHSAFSISNDRAWICGSNKHGQLGHASSSLSVISLDKNNTSIHCSSWLTFLISSE